MYSYSDQIDEPDCEELIDLSKMLHRVYGRFHLWWLCIFEWNLRETKNYHQLFIHNEEPEMVMNTPKQLLKKSII